MKRYAVVDIGTNSARLMIAHVENGSVIADFKTLRLIRVGEGMVGQRVIVPAAMERTKQSLLEYLQISKEYCVQKEDFFVFATSAVRDAQNNEAFCDYIRQECDTSIDIISGDREALLGFAGCIDGEGAMFDIGGGSTEVMQGSLSDVRFAHSFQIGTVRMLQMFPSGDDADPKAFEDAHALAAKTFAKVPDAGSLQYIGIGGTATALAALDLGLTEYIAERIQGHRVTLKRAQELCEMLKSKTKEQRKEIAGLPEKKADVIVFGAIIFLEFMKAVGAKAIIVSDSDNQEGYLKFKLDLIEACCH
jgi:exopolyphosphatase/guanosine-5'-triphosphate,3'-diphosphate pyrophosphatase